MRGFNIFESLTAAFHKWYGRTTDVEKMGGRIMTLLFFLPPLVFWSAAQWRRQEPSQGYVLAGRERYEEHGNHTIRCCTWAPRALVKQDTRQVVLTHSRWWSSPICTPRGHRGCSVFTLLLQMVFFIVPSVIQCINTKDQNSQNR
jgi:hypothetical protein